MTKNHKSIIVLTFLFFAIFSVMVVAGIGLTYESVSNKNSVETTVKLNASNKSLELELKTAIPGIVLIVFGSVGLFIMLFKVPAKEFVGYQNSQGSGSGNVINSSLTMLPKPIYSHKTTKIPLLIWWLIKSKGIFSKVEENA